MTAKAGSSTPDSRPRWSNTTVPGSRCSMSAAATIWSARRWICTCQPSGSTRRASGSIMSSVVAAVLGSNWVKRMPRMPAVGHPLQLGVGDGRMNDRDAARRRPKLRDGIERHRVVGVIGRRRHHDGAAGSDSLLEQPIVGDARVRLHARLRPRRREARAVVDVHVAVAGVFRRNGFRLGGTGRVGDLHAAELTASIPPQSMLWSGRACMAFFPDSLRSLTVLLITGGASAHPHVWVTMKSEIVFAPDGSAVGVRHSWAFDDMYSAFATQGLEQKKKGEFTRRSWSRSRRSTSNRSRNTTSSPSPRPTARRRCSSSRSNITSNSIPRRRF